jgi:hypothetical protein
VETVSADTGYYDTMAFLPRLVELGLSGTEYKHPTQSPERQRAVQEAARRYGLFLTGGSDFHGLYSENPILPGAMDAELPGEFFPGAGSPAGSWFSGE